MERKEYSHNIQEGISIQNIPGIHKAHFKKQKYCAINPHPTQHGQLLFLVY